MNGLLSNAYDQRCSQAFIAIVVAIVVVGQLRNWLSKLKPINNSPLFKVEYFNILI